ncbi:hypothetical protein CLV84_0153 [Neolewinella xylanilytica]|uniref:Phospholipase D-like protein n=1 Tax=Neolewinella xylanilytica TaxID=1514080 RepID=A0A2S6I6V9_9BACT|nr:hypothetical protein [Neolewinella xylanilytica]PPK87217.1 hypothetical protein CLV84_0153 [Neolewinella xylanilytica]
MPYQFALILLVLILVGVLIYRPIMKLARRDMAARTAAGLSNSVVYAILLLPVIGPVFYLLVRRAMLPKE